MDEWCFIMRLIKKSNDIMKENIYVIFERSNDTWTRSMTPFNNFGGGNSMEVFSNYIEGIDHPDHRMKFEEILAWVAEKFPDLEPQIKWNTPMFSHHGTFIIGMDVAKKHMSFAPEEVTMAHFADDIAQAGYSATKGLFRIKWNDPVNYELLEKIIAFNIQDKADCTTFWRK